VQPSEKPAAFHHCGREFVDDDDGVVLDDVSTVAVEQLVARMAWLMW